MNILSLITRFFSAPLLLGATVWLLCAPGAGAISLDRTYAFTGQPGDGDFPAYGSSLIAGGSALFGVTEDGGASNSGALFMISTNLTTPKIIHSFNGDNIANSAGLLTDGALPFGTPLLLGTTLYGATSAGGTNGLGVIYKVNTNGSGFTILHHFNISGDGSVPYGSLVRLGATLYGLTTSGGTNGDSLGTIYSIGTNGENYTTLYSFSPGGGPEGSLVVSGSILYGMTLTGGSNNVGNIFAFDTTGSGYHDLHSFTGLSNDGSEPYGSLVVSGSILYGMTSTGGSNSVGTVFQMGTDGSGFQIMHHFGLSEAWQPVGDLTLSGNTLYGMTRNSAANIGSGTIFQIYTDGTGYEILHGFDFPAVESDGSTPYGSLLFLGSELYGMTALGGIPHDGGVIFALNPAAGVVNPDKIPPTVAVTYPTNGQIFVTSPISIGGTAADNVAVAYVKIQLNNGTWLNTFSPNGDATWEFPILNIVPGTNTISAVAVDTSDNFSKTNTVKFVYVEDATLTVFTNGPGGIAPPYNGVSLQDASFYSMTAKADTGCEFVNWTDGNNDVVTNGATLHFMMANHLIYVANFKDVTKPTITVTSPKTGAKTNVGAISLTGTASDNVKVASVWYSLNNAAFTPANGSSNWTASVNLTPGANTVKLYSEDSSGNLSTTDSVAVDYILSAPLTVQIIGSGTLSTDYNNDLLVIGTSYHMTAKPAKGFAFYFWNNGGQMSSNPTLDFIMSSNLVITANFKDITPPIVTITSPKANVKYSNDTINVTGTASDNVAVTAVGVQINDQGWNTPEGLTSWTIGNLPVISGTNILQAYAMDAAGNLVTNMIKFLGVLPPDWAPASLNGSAIAVVPISSDAITASFGATTFSQSDTNVEGSSGTGGYEYDQTSTNTASLEIAFQSPPPLISNGSQEIQLTFTNLDTGTFTNLDSKDTGTFAIQPVASLLPATLTGHSLVASSVSGGHTTTVAFSKSGSTDEVKITESNSSTVQTGTFVETAASPDSAMLVVTYTDSADLGNVAYLQLTFGTASAGNYEVNVFFSGGGFDEGGLGSFTWH